jgi:cytoskeletal protein RodZ
MATVLQHHPHGAHFGEFLRGARERRGLTLRDVSNETKIPWRHLEAFEHGDLTVVRNRMYRRAEVRAYAQAVGLDQNVALAELENALLISGTADPEPEVLQTLDSIERRHQIAATLATVAVGGILLIMWQLWTKPPAERATAQPAPAVASPEVGPNTPASAPANVAPAESSIPLSPPAPAPTVPVSAPAAISTADAANSLIVTSDPAGARVTVDGIGWGTTPVTIRFLTPGERTIRVIKDGYASEERSVRITDSRLTSVHVPLRTAAN